jgi:hypothetical protein
VTVVVAGAVVAGLLVLGPPETERRRRIDDVRIQDLMALRGAVDESFARDGRLPASLAELAARSPHAVRINEPAENRPYGYEAIDDSTFRLCATFGGATKDQAPGFGSADWPHRAGRQCYRFRIGETEGPGPRWRSVPIVEEPEDSPR